ncbi:cell wall-binding repeat-containing protein [Euzebya sp.]|uniref:cell wall-binding repeat-containing protein n=1 Tax=Euzebya sp. TaxID=1971409 RepID=UPI003511DF3F
MRSLLITLLVLAGVLAGTPVAARSQSADLTVDLTVVDDGSDPQVVRARLTNRGPDDAEHPILRVAVERGAITAHTGDPQPGSLADGVGCAADEAQVSCSVEHLAANTSMSMDVAVSVRAGTSVRAVAEAAGTPDPHPGDGNSAEVALRPPAADLAITDVVLRDPDGGGDVALAAARVVELRATVVHRGGREADVDLVVVGVDRLDHDGCHPDGAGWRCPLGRAAPGTQRTVALPLERPEPGEDARAVTLTAVAQDLTDPDPAAATTTVDLAPRTPVAGEVVRHAGGERIATAVAVSRARFEAGPARAVVLARADAPADALAGGPLAAELSAPILLTSPGDLPPATLAEIDRVLDRGRTVHLLGGTAAIGEAVAAALEDAGYATTRVMGPNRYATAVAIYEALGRPPTVAAADGDAHADAVVAGAAMAAAGGALVLTAGDRVPDELAPLTSRIDWAIGASAAAALPGTAALSGSTPAGTSVAVARAFGAAPRVVGLATAEAFPDALAGGPLVAGLGAPLLLSDTDRLSEAVADYLADTTTVTAAHLLGGTSALSAAVEDAVAALIAR